VNAEATSEHVKCPLYVIGRGELARQTRIRRWRAFAVTTAYKDATDVFLEPRSLDDLERNAKVVVLGSLRHVVYYRGILFLMMNRAQAFDEAFLSRIHVVLHSSELSAESQSRAQV
ncbi:hypothetical protein B0H12DRAFT_1031266, partial [Mycena haematopus]